MKTNETCPFLTGTRVVYRPSPKGIGNDVMAPPSQRLVPGNEYVVKEIQDGSYVVVEGYNHPGGGIYWTEFEIK